MRQNKIYIHIVVVFLALILLLDANTAFAQVEFRLDEVTPNQASPGETVVLDLWGDGFESLPELNNVVLVGRQLDIRGYAVHSNQHIQVEVFIPEGTPLGETEIRFIFEGIALDAFFIVTPPREQPEPTFPEIREISPRSGQLDTDIQLSMRGDSLFELGELTGVSIAEIEVPFWDYRVLSDQSANVWIYLPEELPAGSGEITLFYGNYIFQDRFTTSEADGDGDGNGFSTLFMIFIGVVVVVAVVFLVRMVRGRKTPKDEPVDRPTEPEAKIDFKVEVDPGTQSVESTGPSQGLELKLRFEVETDPGVQSIESNDSFIDDDATLLSR